MKEAEASFFLSYPYPYFLGGLTSLPLPERLPVLLGQFGFDFAIFLNLNGFIKTPTISAIRLLRLFSTKNRKIH